MTAPEALPGMNREEAYEVRDYCVALARLPEIYEWLGSINYVAVYEPRPHEWVGIELFETHETDPDPAFEVHHQIPVEASDGHITAVKRNFEFMHQSPWFRPDGYKVNVREWVGRLGDPQNGIVTYTNLQPDTRFKKRAERKRMERESQEAKDMAAAMGDSINTNTDRYTDLVAALGACSTDNLRFTGELAHDKRRLWQIGIAPDWYDDAE